MSEFNPNAKPEQTAEKKKLFGWFSKKKQRDNSDNEIQYDEFEDKEVAPIEQISESIDTPESPSETNDSTQEQSKLSFYKKLKQGLSKTRGQFSSGLANLVLGQKEIDEDSLEEIETLLLMADVGVETTGRIIDDLTERSNRKELKSTAALITHLRGQLLETLTPVQQPLVVHDHKPFVILLVGINGVGKTTTIGKMAHKFIAEGKSVMLAAGDTFRAAAVEQLKAWGDRNNVPVVAQHTGADSASVIYDAVEKAKAKNVDIIIADTAGRLHTKGNLMEELAKIKRVVAKLDSQAPHEVMLVVDAGTGQNALVQAVEFDKIVKLNSVTVTKLDGTAKGGVVFAIADKMKLPIRYIGVGEAKEDLREFNAEDYIQALFDETVAN